MKRALFTVFLIIFAVNIFALEADTVINTKTAKVYDNVEVKVNYDVKDDNPYDYSSLNLRAYFKDPFGKVIKTDGFYMTDMDYEGDNKFKKGVNYFSVRFTPDIAGDWEYRVNLYSGKDVLYKSEWESFKCEEGDVKGFIKISSSDPLFLEHEGKEPFFAKGVNLCWSTGKMLEDYEKWMNMYAERGVNTVRIWMAPWSFSIEQDKLGSYGGRQEQAYMLDRIFEMAKERDMYIMLCMMPHGELSTAHNSEWGKNPYSAANGGPLSKPEEFFVSEKAKKLFKNRLRYINARWGYSKNLLAWELFNEVDLTDNYNTEKVKKWHKEMFDYLESVDVNEHLMTTSFSNPSKDDEIWEMKEVDIVQTHMYFLKDAAEELCSISRMRTQKFSKPHLVGEFGISIENEFADKGQDREGVNLHNAIWGTAFSLSCGYAMSWYWDYYIDKYDLYYYYKPLNDFIEGVNWARGDFYELANTKVVYNDAKGKKRSDVIIKLPVSWGRAKGDKVILKSEGNIINKSDFTGFLYGKVNNEFRTTPKLVMKNMEPGRLIIKISEVSNNNTLEVAVNGEKKVYEVLNAEDFPGNSCSDESSDCKVKVDKEIILDLHVGDNEVEISNTGDDWVLIDLIKVTDYINEELAPVFVSGIQSETFVMAWIKNKDYTWEHTDVKEIDASSLGVEGLEPARYITKVVDPYSGDEITEQQDIIEEGKILKVKLPAFKKDIAVKVQRYKDSK